MKKVLKTYHIMADLELWVGIDIKAVSLEDALEQSRKLKELDFVDVKDEFMDGKIKITGIYT